jgi:hypothetical protein
MIMAIASCPGGSLAQRITKSNRRGAPTNWQVSQGADFQAIRDRAMARAAVEGWSMNKKNRTETDTFGPVEVDASKYWGAQAQRSSRPKWRALKASSFVHGLATVSGRQFEHCHP